MPEKTLKDPSRDLRVVFADPILYTPGYDTPLVRHLRDEGVDLDFAACQHLRKGEAEHPDFEFCRWIHRHRRWLVKHVYIRRMFRLIEYPMDLIRFWKHIRREEYHVVHFNWLVLPYLDLLYVRMLRKNGFPIVFTVHDARPHESRKVPRINVAAWEEVDHIIALTEAIKADIVGEGIPSEKIAVIPHGDLTGYFPVEAHVKDGPLPENFEGCPVVAFMGRISPYKGVPDLLRAWPKIVEQIPEAKLLLGGSLFPGTYRKVLEEELEALGPLTETIHSELSFLSPQRYAAYLSQATVLVQPYRRGSQSGNTVEAYRFGVPVVCTRVGGLADMVEEGRSGATAEPGNTDSLVEAVVKVLRTNSNGEMSDHCKELAATKYSWRQIADATLDVYRRSIKGSK